MVLAVLLTGSWWLRVLLAQHGGAYFWLDESQRFSPCVQVVDAIRHHGANWHEVGDVLAVNQRHIGFFLVGIPVALVSEWLGIGARWVPGAILSLASVVCIALTYAVARRSGAGPGEAIGAAFLMTCANSMFYSARHILPYESGLAASLGVLWVTLGTSRSLLRSYLIGVAGSLAYLVYYGYLSTVLVVLGLYVLRPWRWRTACAVGVGFVTPPLLLHAFTLWWALPDGNPFLVGLWRLMHEANQGDYAEGWRVPWAVLWHLEHGFLLVWLAGTLGAIALWWIGKAGTRHGLWLIALGLLYGQMALESSVLRIAVVEGRFSRQLVPFFCLLTAATLAVLVRDYLRVPRAVAVAAFLACLTQAAANFITPLRMHFPSDVHVDLVRRYDTARFALSVTGPKGWENRGPQGPTRYVLLNTVTWLYPVTGETPPLRGRVVEWYAHPLQFVPYQYEVFGPESRVILQTADIRMRVIDTRP